MKNAWRGLLLLGLLLLWIPAQAADQWDYRVEDGLAYLTAYKGPDAEVIVPQEVDGIPVYGIDSNAIPASAAGVTVPVSVGSLSDTAVPEGTVIRARHGAYALQWATEHDCEIEDLSAQDFSVLVVDLTGSDYRETEGGYSLGPALGKAVSPGIALYIPETGKAWGVNELTKQGDRYLAAVEEADPLLTYNTVVYTSRAKARSVDVGKYTVSFQPEGEYRIPLNPVSPLTTRLVGGLDPYVIVRNLDVSIEINSAALISKFIPMSVKTLVWGWNISSVLTNQPDNYVDINNVITKCYVYADYDVGISLTTLPSTEVIEIELGGWFIPLGESPFVLEPFAMLQYSLMATAKFDFGCEHTQLIIDYNNEGLSSSLNGNVVSGTPYFRSQYIESSSFALNAGIALNCKPNMQIAEIVYNCSLTTDTQEAYEEGYAGTQECRDVTWEAMQEGQLTFNPGFDLMPWKTGHFKVNLYNQWDFEIADSVHLGATFGTINSIYITREFLRHRINWSRTINNSTLQSGETGHFERDWYGNWERVDNCTKQHALHFDPVLEGIVSYDVDCSELKDDYGWSDWKDLDKTLYYPGKNFLGWYTDEGDKYFDNISAYNEPFNWNGTKTLTARWEDADTDWDEYPEYWSNYYNQYEGVKGGASSTTYEDPDGVERTYFLGRATNTEDIVAYYDQEFATLSAQQLVDKYAYSYMMAYPSSVFTKYNFDTQTVSKDAGYKNYRAVVDGTGSATLTSAVYNQRVYRSEGYANSPNLETVTGNGHMIDIGLYAMCTKLASITGIDGLTFLHDHVFANCWSLSNISLPSTMKTIGKYAFTNCYALKQINLPEGLETIGEMAFRGSGLTSVTVPSSVKRIETQLFKDCTALTSAVLTSVEDIGYSVFKNTPSLETVSISGDDFGIDQSVFEQSGIRELTIQANDLSELALHDLQNLESLTIYANSLGNVWISQLPKLKSVTIHAATVEFISAKLCPELISFDLQASQIESLYVQQCHALNRLEATGISKTDTLGISWCDQLEVLRLSGETRSANIHDCPRLTELVLGPITGEEYSGIILKNLDSLTRFDLAEGSDTHNSNWNATFQYCFGLCEVTIPSDADATRIYIYDSPPAVLKRRASSVSTGNATALMHFTGLYGEESNDLWLVPGSEFVLFAPRMATYYYSTFQGWVLNGDTGNLYQTGDTIIVPSGESTLYAVYESSFYSMDIQDGVFLGYVRYALDKKMNLRIPDEVTALAANCIGSGENSVYISRNVRTIDPQAFALADSLMEIEVDPGNQWFYASDGVLYSRAGILVTVPAHTRMTEYSIPAGITAIGPNAFSGDITGKLISVVIPDSVTSFGENWCGGIRSCEVYGPVTGPAAEAAAAENLNYNMFPVWFISGGACVAAGAGQAGTELPELRNLRDDGSFLGWSLSENGPVVTGPVTIPYGGITLYARWRSAPVPSAEFVLPEMLDTIGEDAFSGLKMRSVKIPAAVQQIAPRAFNGCDNLKLVIILSRNAVIDPDAFRGAPATMTIYGYDGSTAETFAGNKGYSFVSLGR